MNMLRNILSNAITRLDFRITGLLVLSVLLSGCIPKRFSIEGKLLALASRTPLSQMTLRLQNLGDGSTQVLTTNSNGEFSQDRLLAGTYRITSADTTKILVSPEIIEINAKSEPLLKVPTLRGLQSPPKPGVYAWIGQSWREIAAIRDTNGGEMISREQANNVVTVPESASLLVWLPGHRWGEAREGVNWVMATFTENAAHFMDGELHERTPEGEPAGMDPAAFPDWNLPGVLPLRGPSTPNLYAIEVTNTQSDGIVSRVLYPFWVPMRDGTQPQFNTGSASSNPISSIITGSTMRVVTPRIDSLPPGTQDLFTKALNAALASVGLKPQSGSLPGITSSGTDTTHTTGGATVQSAPVPTPQRTDITPEQVSRWREQIRNARTDTDVYRRRQLWKAIRDSAEGTDVALEADRLLMRDLNGLPLK